jgi:cytochrome oxidase assembly protein ShyY1
MSPRARILFVVLMFLVAATCTRLGMWQRARLQARRAANEAAREARAQPPVDLAAAGDAPLADRRVTARGTFDHAHDMLLRGQVLGGAPGVVVVTPLMHAHGDSALLVVRGFLPSNDGISVPLLDSLQEGGEQSIAGIGRALPLRTGRGQPLARGGRMTWKELELEPLRRELPYPLMGVLLFATPAPGQPAWPRRLEPPPLDDGPHLSYMLQWFGFATVAVIMALLALRRRQAAGWSEPTAASSSAAAPPPVRSP